MIRCGSDPRVFDCIQSVDEEVDIMISAKDDPVFLDSLRDAGVRYCVSESNNLSVVSNDGIEHALNDRVFLTDSDTVLCKGCLEAIDAGLDDHDVVSAEIVFDSGHSMVSRWISNSRSYVNSKDLAFTPGLGMDRRISDRIGGFIFDPNVRFAVDANLDYRIRRSGIDVQFDSGARIIHSMETVRHDLMAARRIGKGVVAGAMDLHRMYPSIPENTIRRDLKAVHVGDYPEIIRRYGPGTMLYQIIWDMNFYIGRGFRWCGRDTTPWRSSVKSLGAGIPVSAALVLDVNPSFLPMVRRSTRCLPRIPRSISILRGS